MASRVPHIMDFDDEGVDLAAQLAAQATDAEKKSRGKEGGKTAKAKAKAPAKLCFVCAEAAMKSKRWCVRHNRAYDCMAYQAKAKGEMQSLERALADAANAASVFEKFLEENPSTGKWRRKALIEWSTFKKEFCVTRTARDRDGTIPFELGQWMKRGESIMGWSAAATKKQWDEYLKNPAIKRDSKGLDKSLCLWLPVLEETHGRY